MLARPEINSLAHILLWLASKPVNEEYDWVSTEKCACGQYAKEHKLGYLSAHGQYLWSGVPNLVSDYESPDAPRSLNNLASERPHTFGALYLRARAAWPNA